jgi:hypothetical protein
MGTSSWNFLKDDLHFKMGGFFIFFFFLGPVSKRPGSTAA